MSKNTYNSKQLENLKNYFAPYILPKSLVELIKFDDEYGASESYVECFGICDNEADFLEAWLPEMSDEKLELYTKSVKVFARADGTGAIYAMWIEEGNHNLENAPIVFYGTEGADFSSSK